MKDSTWVMYNKRLIEAMENNAWYTLGTIYYEMAARVQEEGTDSSYLKEQGYNAKVRHHQADLDNYALSEVEILANGGACSECEPQSGNVVSAEDARLVNYIPVKTCLNVDGCRCTYLPVVPRL